MSVENMVIYLCKLQPTVESLHSVNSGVPAAKPTHNKHTRHPAQYL